VEEVEVDEVAFRFCLLRLIARHASFLPLSSLYTSTIRQLRQVPSSHTQPCDAAQRGDRNLLLTPPQLEEIPFKFGKMLNARLLLLPHHHHQAFRITMSSIIQRAIITSASRSPSPSSSISDSDSISSNDGSEVKQSSNDESEVKQTKQMKDWRPKSTFWQKKFRDMTWAERYEAGTASFFFSLYLPALEL
jgi:hypothetical protein